MKRYHKNVFMPELNIIGFWNTLPKIKFRKHFFYRMEERNKVCKGFFIPTLEQFRGGEVFEVYVERGIIEKVCVRVEGRKSYAVGYCGTTRVGSDTLRAVALHRQHRALRR